MSEADKQVALEKLRLERSEMDGVTKRWVADARSGTWLASNVRPLVLVFLTTSYVAGWYLGYPLDEITGLLTIVIGGYFGSRGVEKVLDRKSTRLNSSHGYISYAVFCLKKKKLRRKLRLTTCQQPR